MGTKAGQVLGLSQQARRRVRPSQVGALALLLCIPLLSGCGLLQRFLGGGDSVDQTFEPGPIVPGPLPNGEAEDFDEPLIPAAPQASVSAELIQSTDPEERFQQVTSSRPDPFATVPIPPPPQVIPPPPPAPIAAPGTVVPPAPTPGAPLTTTPPTGAPAAGTTTPTPGAPAAGTTTPRPGAPAAGTTTPRPGAPGAPATAPGATPPGEIALTPLPELPQPAEAEAIIVTGVINVGGRNYAIIQSPQEPTGRYVTAGQRVAGGAVLVKRIDMRGSEPIVVLEQNGVEVSQFVGPRDEPETAT